MPSVWHLHCHPGKDTPFKQPRAGKGIKSGTNFAQVATLMDYSASQTQEEGRCVNSEGLFNTCRQAATVEFARCPLIANPPPLVMDSSRLTLLDLGRRDYLPSSDLPPACQVRPDFWNSCRDLAGMPSSFCSIGHPTGAPPPARRGSLLEKPSAGRKYSTEARAMLDAHVSIHHSEM